jgi:hypothetical protein
LDTLVSALVFRHDTKMSTYQRDHLQPAIHVLPTQNVGLASGAATKNDKLGRSH